jgi:hypothetical protein
MMIQWGRVSLYCIVVGGWLLLLSILFHSTTAAAERKRERVFREGCVSAYFSPPFYSGWWWWYKCSRREKLRVIMFVCYFKCWVQCILHFHCVWRLQRRDYSVYMISYSCLVFWINYQFIYPIELIYYPLSIL